MDERKESPAATASNIYFGPSRPIVHGGRDPLVSVADKTWLRDTVNGLGLTDGIKLTLFDDGDHCCTQYVTEIRRAAAAEFLDAYTQRTAA